MGQLLSSSRILVSSCAQTAATRSEERASFSWIPRGMWVMWSYWSIQATLLRFIPHVRIICHTITTVGDYAATKQQLCTALRLHILRATEQFLNLMHKVLCLISKFTEMGYKKKEEYVECVQSIKHNDKRIKLFSQKQLTAYSTEATLLKH
jgi:hypothetical protein